MKVQQIVDRKQTVRVETIAANITLEQAAAKLAELRIGCLMVADAQGKLEGVLSERDIVRTLGKEGLDSMQKQVGDVMTREVSTCVLEDDSDSVSKRMTAGRFRHMPVLKDGGLLAVISLGDVVSARMAVLEREKQALEGLIHSSSDYGG